MTEAHEAGGDAGALRGGPGIPLVSSSVAARSPISKPGFPDDLPENWEPLDILSHGRRSLVGYSPWGCEESDTTERLHFQENKKKGRKEEKEKNPFERIGDAQVGAGIPE